MVLGFLSIRQWLKSVHSPQPLPNGEETKYRQAPEDIKRTCSKLANFMILFAQSEIQILNGLFCPRDRHEKRPIHVVSLVHDLCTGAFRQKQAQDQANKEPFAVAHIYRWTKCLPSWICG